MRAMASLEKKWYTYFSSLLLNYGQFVSEADPLGWGGTQLQEMFAFTKQIYVLYIVLQLENMWKLKIQ